MISGLHQQLPLARCVRLCRRSGVRSRAAADVQAPTGIRIRRGTQQDAQLIADAIRRESMYPIGLDATRFLLAEDQQGKCLGFGQLEPKDAGVYELRSMVVIAKSNRRKGIGTALLQALMQSLHDDEEVWLTTPQDRMPFYHKAGFEGRPVDLAMLQQIPKWLVLEAVAGYFVAPLVVGQRLTVMRRGTKKLDSPF